MLRSILAAALLTAATADVQAQTTYYVPNGVVPGYNPYRPGGTPIGTVPGATPYGGVASIATAPPGVVLPGQTYLRTSPSDPFGLGNNTTRDFQTATPQAQPDREKDVRPAAPASSGVQTVPTQTTVVQQNRPGQSVDPKGMIVEGPAAVIDGDTLTVGDRLVTLFGADAPEVAQICAAQISGWRCGEKARDRLTALVDGKRLRCVGQIQAGDAVSSICVTVDGVDPADVLVQEGLAVVPKAVSTRYVAQESEARLGRRGIWVGSFELPWDFRRKALRRPSIGSR
jgi:endonuclease YncB( thermonuclease family)